jgi:hypothetical protein
LASHSSTVGGGVCTYKLDAICQPNPKEEEAEDEEEEEMLLHNTKTVNSLTLTKCGSIICY